MFALVIATVPVIQVCLHCLKFSANIDLYFFSSVFYVLMTGTGMVAVGVEE